MCTAFSCPYINTTITNCATPALFLLSSDASLTFKFSSARENELSVSLCVWQQRQVQSLWRM